MNPIPTEYCGVRFDSKSEAVFARCLDLAGIHWSYHPPEHCNHVWDFLVHILDPGKRYDKMVLVEYKPMMPTMTYVENLTNKMSTDPRESIVVWGSPWNESSFMGPWDPCYITYPIYFSYGKYGWGDFIPAADCGDDVPYSYRHQTDQILGISDPIAQEAKRYRFDLAQAFQGHWE